MTGEDVQSEVVGESGDGIDVVLVTGLSGAGRGTAAKVLEDLGWYVADNLPPELIARMVELGLAAGSRITQLAVVMEDVDQAWSVFGRTYIARILDDAGQEELRGILGRRMPHTLYLPVRFLRTRRPG